MKKRLLIASIFVLIFSLTAAPALAITEADIDAEIQRELSDPLTKAIQDNLQYTVSVNGITPTLITAGTGIIVGKNGLILTNKHVVYDPSAKYYIRLPNGTELSAQIWYRDPTYDFALLKVNTTFTNVAILDAGNVIKGERVGTIGNAGGTSKFTTTTGAIYALNRAIYATAGDIAENLTGLLESTAPLAQGASGGPLITTTHKIIGLDVAVDPDTNHSYAIPMNVILPKISGYLLMKS